MSPTGPDLRRRRSTIATLIAVGMCGLLLIVLAVSSAVNRGQSWVMYVVTPVITGLVVWLIVRRQARR